MPDHTPIARRTFLKCAAAAATCAGLGLPADHAMAAGADPLPLSPGPHLFVDDFLIAESQGIRKVMQHPKRALDGPVLGWREHTTQPYVTVLRDAASGRFRMWYDYDIGAEAAIAYAESEDGVQWTLPRLDLMGPDNRLFRIGRGNGNGSFGVSVVDDGPNARDPRRRYKLMWWSGTCEPPGASMAFSPDGIHWTAYERNPVLPYYPPGDPKVAAGVGDVVDLFRDPVRNRYGVLMKMQATPADRLTPGPRAGKGIRRLVGASYSEDGVHWKEPWRVMMPESRDAGILEFYSAGGTIARGPLLVSFVRMLHDDYSPEPGGQPTGIGYTTLATSRDGVHWSRQDDVFFDRNPEPHTWDRAMTWVGCALPVGDKLFLYYGGYARGHKVEPTKERQIGLARMPMDRFVSVEPSAADAGTVRTIPMRVPVGATSLVINAAASGGRICVAVRGADGAVVPGYGLNESVAVTTDGLREPVRWKDRPQLPSGQVIQLEFELANAKLFAFDGA